jgi:superfamily II DNA or RNA helicase
MAADHSNPSSPSTWLGLRGYAISKAALETPELMQIRKDLTMQPSAPQSPTKPEPFPIYIETPTVMYVPRYYGLETYGDPEQVRIHAGAPAPNLEFAGELRDYQTAIVNKYVQHVQKPLSVSSASGGGGGGGCLDVDPGKGKTVMALKIMSVLKVKTLVIVHKTFLMNQWLERIQQFLPGARVGRIQGQEVDVEDKDIVIGMLQSLSMKDYDERVFEGFGFSVFDECHHMSAEVFCRCMMKVTTRYTLGLSGTMTRKDGLTKVFIMFLGEIVHKEKSSTQANVVVKSIQIYIPDDEFNVLETDYRGNPKFSTMITKLCKCEPRSEFILSVLENELRTSPDQQVMILAHNKSLLSYMYDTIVERNIAGCGANVGYYLGGMKDTDLKASESKKVIIATYAMASEGLDIPSLTTLIMATPKTDVCQSVGRILRAKHASPLVIDFVDHHDIFKSQWMKRQAYYLKQGYRIMYTNNAKYAKNIWKTRDGKGDSDASTQKATTSTTATTATATIKAVPTIMATKVKASPFNTHRPSSATAAANTLFSPFIRKKTTASVATMLQMQMKPPTTSTYTHTATTVSATVAAPVAANQDKSKRVHVCGIDL